VVGYDGPGARLDVTHLVRAMRSDHKAPLRVRAMRELRDNRLLQFFIIGAAIFAMTPSSQSTTIHITADEIGEKLAAQARRDGAPFLTRDRVDEVIARIRDDAVLYREGLRLGLDKNDHIIEERVIQKVLALSEELGGASAPVTGAALEAHFEDTKVRWRSPAQWHFTHVFVRSDHEEELPQLLAKARRLDAAGQHGELALGDAFVLSRTVPYSTATE